MVTSSVPARASKPGCGRPARLCHAQHQGRSAHHSAGRHSTRHWLAFECILRGPSLSGETGAFVSAGRGGLGTSKSTAASVMDNVFGNDEDNENGAAGEAAAP